VALILSFVFLFGPISEVAQCTSPMVHLYFFERVCVWANKTVFELPPHNTELISVTSIKELSVD
jgi:hypothetical protein